MFERPKSSQINRLYDYDFRPISMFYNALDEKSGKVPVRARVGSVKNNDPSLIEPIAAVG